MSKNLNKKTKKKSSFKKKFLISFSLTCIFILSIAAGGIFAYSYGLLYKIDQVELDKDDLSANSYVSDNNIKNIALFGVDSSDGGYGRSDSILILTIDKINNELKLSSIMRDSYVYIPGYGNDKITHAYAYGGPQLAIKTLNENFNLDIEDFATVDFESFPKIIDALGGIDINITQEEIDAYININHHIEHLNILNQTSSPLITTPGLQHVDGTQALAYSRIRYTDGGDSARTDRQRIVLQNLIEKLKETPIKQYTSLLNEFLPLIKTSLTSNQILGIASDVLKLNNSSIKQKTYPLQEDMIDSMINGIYYLQFNKNNTINEMHNFIFGNNLEDTSMENTHSEAENSSENALIENIFPES